MKGERRNGVLNGHHHFVAPFGVFGCHRATSQNPSICLGQEPRWAQLRDQCQALPQQVRAVHRHRPPQHLVLLGGALRGADAGRHGVQCSQLGPGSEEGVGERYRNCSLGKKTKFRACWGFGLRS